MKVINNNETLVNTNATTNDDTSYYAILSDSSNQTYSKAEPVKETLLTRIQRGVGFEIDSSGLAHYYLSSVRLSPGKGKKNIIKKEETAKKMKKRFFYKPIERKYDFAFDIDDCFVGFCCPTALFDTAPKCKIRTKIEVKSWKKIPEKEEQQNDNAHTEMITIGKPSTSWEARQQARRNKMQHSMNGNVVTNGYYSDIVRFHTLRQNGRETTLAVRFMEYQEMTLTEVEADVCFLVIPWYSRRWLSDE